MLLVDRSGECERLTGYSVRGYIQFGFLERLSIPCGTTSALMPISASSVRNWSSSSSEVKSSLCWFGSVATLTVDSRGCRYGATFSAMRTTSSNAGFADQRALIL